MTSRDSLRQLYRSKDGFEKSGGLWPIAQRVPVAFALAKSYSQSMEVLNQDDLVRLTPPERLALISQLWDSLDDDNVPLSAAQRAELDRRLETIDQDRREGITWMALKVELEQRSTQAPTQLP